MVAYLSQKVCGRRELCVHGNVEQAISEFYPTATGGRESWCRSCKMKQRADYKAMNKRPPKPRERRAPRFGEHSQNHRLTTDQVAQIRALYPSLKMWQIAEHVGVSMSYVSEIVSYKARPFG